MAEWQLEVENRLTFVVDNKMMDHEMRIEGNENESIDFYNENDVPFFPIKRNESIDFYNENDGLFHNTMQESNSNEFIADRIFPTQPATRTAALDFSSPHESSRFCGMEMDEDNEEVAHIMEHLHKLEAGTLRLKTTSVRRNRQEKGALWRSRNVG